MLEAAAPLLLLCDACLPHHRLSQKTHPSLTAIKATSQPTIIDIQKRNRADKKTRREREREREKEREGPPTNHLHTPKQNKLQKQKMNIEDSNVVPHRSTNSTRQCLTSLSRREAVLSLWYGPSCQVIEEKVYKVSQYVLQVKAPDRIPFHKYISIKKTNFNSTRGI